MHGKNVRFPTEIFVKISEERHKHWGCAAFFIVLQIQNLVKRVDKGTRYCILRSTANKSCGESI